MTREEKLELLNRLLEIEEKNDIGNLTRAERGEFQQWVKALEQEPCCNCIEFKRYAKEIGFEIEQEPILDKIRAEIMAIGNWTTKGELPNGYLIKVIEIIDKYKAESEK